MFVAVLMSDCRVMKEIHGEDCSSAAMNVIIAQRSKLAGAEV